MGFSAAANASNQGTQQAMMMQALQAQQAQQAIQQGQQQASGALQQGQTQGVNALQAGQTGALGALQNYYNQGVGYQQPYMNAGAQATNQLAAMYAPGGQYGQMPTAAQLQMDPSYAWRFQQGQQAAQNAIAAGLGGASVGGSALKAINDYGQNAASQEYSNAYNRFMQQAQLQTGALQNLAGTGASAAQTASQLAGQTGNTLAQGAYGTGQNQAQAALNTGGNIGQAYTGNLPTMAALTGTSPYGSAMENAAQARASGYVGGTSALGNALQGGVNGMLAYSMLNRMPQSNAAMSGSGYMYGTPSAAGYGAGYNPGFLGAPTV